MWIITRHALLILALSLESCIVGECERISTPDAHSPVQKNLQSTPKESVPVHITNKTKQSFWTHPVTLGLLLGLLLIGPDHLGTIMALSTLTTGVASFKIGFSWGLGHSMGMIMLCPMFFLLRKLSSDKMHLSTEQWEYFGDYFIGGSMILVAVYFVVYESSYMEKQADGSYKAKGCSCHGEHETSEEEEAQQTNFCASFSGKQSSCKFGCTSTRGKKARSIFKESLETGLDATLEVPTTVISRNKETTPLLQCSEVAATKSFFSARSIQGAMLGALQGLCCPMGLAGVAFMGHMSTTSSPIRLFVFALVFVLASAIGSGAIAVGWGLLTSRGSAGCVSPRTMYMGSCVATFLLGVCWIVANAAGVLHEINFAEEIGHKIIADHSTTG